MFEGSNYPPPAPDPEPDAWEAGDFDREPVGGRDEESEVSSAGTEPDWSYYPRAIYRRRWTAITVLFVALLVGVMRNVNAVPIYEARVRLLVEPERVNLVKIDDPVSNGTSSDANVAILRSRWLVGKTLESLKLWPATDAAPQASAAAPTKRSPLAKIRETWSYVRDNAYAALGLSEPPVSARLGETAAQSSQIDGFLGGLNVSFTSSGILDISYRSSESVVAARFANAHAEQYIAQALERRFEAVKEVTDWLAVRLAEQRQKLDASEQELARFRDENHLGVVGTDDLAVARLGSLSSDLTKASAVRLEKEAIANRAGALRTDVVAFDRLPQVAASGLVAQLRAEVERLQRERAQLAQTLRERHPDMIKAQNAVQQAQTRLDDERTRLLTVMREEFNNAQNAESALARQLDMEKQRASSQNRKSLQLSILTREVESNRQIYDMLVQRTRDANIAKDINPSRIRILDPALVPQRPVSPNKTRDLMLALAMGFGLAMLLPIGFELLDNRIKSPDQVQSSLGLPFLGLVPEHPSKTPDDSQGAPLITNGVTPQFLEALRQLRTNIVFSFPEGRSRSMVITSAGPEEGKTVLASNVAIGLSQLNQRVLLIDGDMRRPRVHQFFDVPCEPGLSNLLVGETKATDVVLRTNVSNLWVLPAGHRPPNPCDLLGSERFRRFLSAVRDHFDWVLIDAPPVLAVTDACIVSHVTSGVLFVVGSERVTRPEARRAIEQLQSAHAKFAGVVLSRVDLKRHTYYYSRYYRHSYSEYYVEQPARKDAAQSA